MYSTWLECGLEESRLTAINVLGCLLFLGAGAVLGIGLGGETCFGACVVEVAVVVHGLLEGVAFPTKDVVTVSGGTTGIVLAWAKRVGWVKRTQCSSSKRRGLSHLWAIGSCRQRWSHSTSART